MAIPALIAAGASVIGSVLANKASKASTARQIAFQRESIQNRYQWETEDLKKAGLNRIYGYSKGSSPPAAAGASYKAENIGKGVTSALALNAQKSQIANIDANTAKTIQEKGKVDDERQILAQQYQMNRPLVSRSVIDQEYYNSTTGKSLHLFNKGAKNATGFLPSTGLIFNRPRRKQ